MKLKYFVFQKNLTWQQPDSEEYDAIYLKVPIQF